MHRQQIEQSFTNAGWDIDGSFADYLIIGRSGDSVSILAHKETWDAEEPFFELIDHEQMLSYWVRQIPSPKQAQQLLEEHGQPPGVGD